MSGDREFTKAASFLMRLICIGLCLFVLSVVLLNIGFEGEVGAIYETGWHLLTGFAFFLRRNLATISTDAGTWGPGVVAFGLALGLGHHFLRGWAKKRDRKWSMLSTLCVGLLLPVLFMIAFLVPGALVQLEGLAGVKWFQHGYGPLSLARWQTTHVARVAKIWAETENGGRFPDSLNELVKAGSRAGESFRISPAIEGEPAEPLMYFGKGLTIESDASLPLVISPCFVVEGKRIRVVATVGGESIIRDDELDAWIDKAMAARKP